MKKLLLLLGTLILSLNVFASPVCKVDEHLLQFKEVKTPSGIPTLHEVAAIDEELFISSRRYVAYGIGHVVSLKSKTTGKLLINILIQNSDFAEDVLFSKFEFDGYLIECNF